MKPWFFFSFLGLTFLLAETASKERLFSIRRSINDNELIYEVKTTPEGFEQEDPIHIYWIMNTKSGVTEPLTGVEKRRAYGVVLESVSKDKIVFSLKALPMRRVTVTKENGSTLALLQIQGEEAILERIFIKTQPGGPIPRVEYVEVKGKSKSSGKALSEQISTSKKKG